jgi:hypothetical protein
MQALPIFGCFLSILLVLVPSLDCKTTFVKKQTLPLSRLQTPTQNPTRENELSEAKEWNIFVYMAGQNDLFFAIDQNLAQLMSISFGSLCNIIVQVDKFGTRDVIRARIKNGIISPYWRASDTSASERNKNPRLYNSGAVENFIDFLQTGMAQFKAKKQCVVIWDHGSGCFDPLKWRTLICSPDEKVLSGATTRGMAFNDTYNYYLSNQDLTYALETISRTALNNKKIAMLGLDICHGGQVEIAAQVNHVVDYIVASEEVELASGWDYAKAFAKLTTQVRSASELGNDIVAAYKETYLSSVDYTLALYDLSSTPEGQSTTYFELLMQSIDSLALALQALLRCPEKKILGTVITDVRTKKNLFCEFYDNEYIDLHLFLLNLQNNLRQVLNQKNFRYDHPNSTVMAQEAITLCLSSLELLYKVVPLYTAGIAFMGNPIRARGMSITFPLRSLHWSYTQTAFAQKTHWFDFVKECSTRRSLSSPCIF